MSWIKIKQALLDLANAHPQVNSFGTGDPLAVGTDNTINLRTPSRERIVYPLVFADVQSATTDAGTLDLVVGVYFSDRVESIKPMGGVVSGSPTLGWQDNEDEVLSDQLQIAQDFISSLTNDPNEDWTLSASVSLTRFVESRDDRTAGWQATMTFEIPFGHSVCEIPT
jgi:hypothetical protein